MRIYTLILRLVLLLLLQLLFIRPLEIGRWVDFYVYPLFVLLLPVNLRSVTVMLVASVAGLSIDLMQNTPGLHAATLVAIGLLRKPLLQLFVKPDDLKNNLEPMPGLLGNLAFTIYAGTFLLLFHWLLYFIETFSAQLFLFNLFRGILNTLLAIGLSWVLLILFFNTGKK